MRDMVDELKLAAEAYESALECDYCDNVDPEYDGLRPDEIALRIIRLIKAL